MIRHALDTSLRTWNQQQGRTDDWLQDAAAPLRGIVTQADKRTMSRATDAMKRRPSTHARHGIPVLMHSIDLGAVDGLSRLDSVRRTLAMRPRP